MDLLHGAAKTQLLAVAAELGIADLLKDGPKPLKVLAEATGTHAPSLYRALRALAGLGVFAETEPECFTLTPLADLLRTDAPGSLRGLAILEGSAWLNRAWADLLSSVRTGKSYFETTHGVTAFEYLQQHPAELAVFTEAMTSNSKLEAVAVCEAYDFSGFHSMVDVGGEEGFLLATILKAYPALKGMLFDRPEVGARARKLLRAEGLGERCEVIDGDFFAGVPQGGEAYILKNILHDWDDERAEQILTHCRRAIVPGGRVLVVEIGIPDEKPRKQPISGQRRRKTTSKALE